jgi:hypothetical protein
MRIQLLRAAELVLDDVRGSNTDADPGCHIQHAVLVDKGAARATARSSGDDGCEREEGEEGAREDGGHDRAGYVCGVY